MDHGLNSALTWRPAMEAAGEQSAVRIATTEFVAIPEKDAAIDFVDGAPSEFPIQEIEASAERLGYPVFVRTDQTSAKHHGVSGYRARDAEELRIAVSHALEANLMAMSMPAPAAIMLSDWIAIETGFHDTRIGGGLGTRIGREFRLFADSSEVFCTHFYWPADSMKRPSRNDWRAQLSRLADVDVPEPVRDFACQAVAETPREIAWSVDIAQDECGDWWGIDMAVAGMSWHPEDCEHADSFVGQRE